MPVYEIEHPTTGQKIRLEGNGVPSDADIREAFNSVSKQPAQTPASPMIDPATGKPPIDITNGNGDMSVAEKMNNPYFDINTPDKLKAEMAKDKPVPQWGVDHPNLYGVYGASKALGTAAVEGAATAGGATLGTIGGAIAGPVGAGAGGIAGSGAGFAAGKRLSQAIGLSDEPMDNSAMGIGKDVALGAAMGAIPGAAGLAGKGIRALGGDTAMNLLTKVPLGRGMLAEARLPDVGKVASEFDNSFTKAIRPSAKGMRPFKDTAEYNSNAQSAAKEIVLNKDNLGITDAEGNPVDHLPKTLPQMEQAVNSTKRAIWDKVKAINSSAEGAQVPLDPAVGELESIARSGVVKTMSPETANYATTKAKLLRDQKSFTVDETQDAISRANRSADHYYSSPSADTESRAYIDSIVANHLRDGLDATLESVTGTPAAAPLRKAYGSLKAIEADVRQRTLVDARKNPKGIIDFSDIYTSGELIASLAAHNPAGIARGLTMAAMKARLKWWNDPNTHVERLFKLADKLVIKKDFPLPEVAPATPAPIPQPPWAGKVNTGNLGGDANMFPNAAPNASFPANNQGIVQPTPRQQLMGAVTPASRNDPAWNQLASPNLLGTVGQGRSALSATTPTPKNSWHQFLADHMGEYMKSEGDHGKAMTRASKEYNEMKSKK